MYSYKRVYGMEFPCIVSIMRRVYLWSGMTGGTKSYKE